MWPNTYFLFYLRIIKNNIMIMSRKALQRLKAKGLFDMLTHSL